MIMLSSRKSDICYKQDLSQVAQTHLAVSDQT